MRREPMEAERRLWTRLRASRLAGHKVRRQALIGDGIVDFFRPSKGLIVEIDGDTHNDDDDMQRNADIKCRFGFETLRIRNPDVLGNFDGVLEHLLNKLAVMPVRWPALTTPNPSSEEEGRRLHD